jgi:hypothetical protein
VFKAQRSQKLLDRRVKQFVFDLWAEVDLFRTAFPKIFRVKQSVGAMSFEENTCEE